MNRLLITGASGRIARRAAALLAQSGYSLRLMTGNPQQAPKVDGAEVVRGDFAEPTTLDDAFAGMSAALVVSGSGKPGERARLHRNAFEAAARARVSHVVYLSLQGASPNSKYPYSRDHSLSERTIVQRGVTLTLHLVQKIGPVNLMRLLRHYLMHSSPHALIPSLVFPRIRLPFTYTTERLSRHESRRTHIRQRQDRQVHRRRQSRLRSRVGST